MTETALPGEPELENLMAERRRFPVDPAFAAPRRLARLSRYTAAGDIRRLILEECARTGIARVWGRASAALKDGGKGSDAARAARDPTQRRQEPSTNRASRTPRQDPRPHHHPARIILTTA